MTSIEKEAAATTPWSGVGARDSRQLSSSCLAVAVLLVCGISGKLYAQQAAPATRTIAELAAELPPIKPKSPAESLATLELRAGFRAALVAAEPLVRDPTAIAFDEMGRMFVIELPSYNAYAVEGAQLSGSVRLLEDADDDGQYDKSTIYATDLGYPTGISCWDGGIFVGAAPDLIYLKDTDGDGRADQRRVVLTGFGTDASGEGQLNSFCWGFDNRIHISTGLDGGNVRSAGGPESAGVSVRGRGIVLDPRNQADFQLTSGGGQHGMSLDDWGRKFVCENSVPAQTLIYDDRYVARNPNLRAPSAAVDIAPDGKFTTLFRISPQEPWRELRTRLRREGRFRGSDEGGKPFGFFTGATGISVYRGDAWPAEFRGNLFIGDVANNLVYRARVDVEGVGIVARRADPGREFLAGRDIWFRPVQFANAPDGTLYMIDMYRGLIEGAAFLPPEFLTFIDPIGGNELGRIYRIEPQNFVRRQTPKLGDYSTEQLVALLEHPNAWHRDTASRLLYERQDPAAASSLLNLALTSKSDIGRMTALYSLEGQETLNEAAVLAALDDAAPMVKVHAIRLAERLRSPTPELVTKLCSLANDPDVRVRYQLAFSLGSINDPARDQALARIVTEDGHSEWFRIAAQSSLSQHADRTFGLLVANGEFREAAYGKEFLRQLAEQIGRAGRENETRSAARTIARLAVTDATLSADLAESLISHQSRGSREETVDAEPTLRRLLQERARASQLTALRDTAPIESRVRAIRSLRTARFDTVQPIYQQLLDLRQPLEVQLAVLELMAEYENPAVAQIALAAWPTLSPAIRANAVEVLLSRVQWIPLLLDEVEAGRVSKSDIDPARIELLRKHQDDAVARRVQQLFAATALAGRETIVEQFQPALNRSGDPEQGRQVFQKVCSACHQLEGQGTSVGADLRGIANRGAASILLNILDPNREVKPKFLTYVVATEDGRTLSGMIESESANSLQIRQADGTTVALLRSQIEELRSSGISFMPEGLEKQLDPESMADLLAYLMTQP